MFLQKAMKNHNAALQMNQLVHTNALSSGITSGQQTGQFGSGSILNSNKRDSSLNHPQNNYNTVQIASYNPAMNNQNQNYSRSGSQPNHLG
jgi:hypothetical protein